MHKPLDKKQTKTSPHPHKARTKTKKSGPDKEEKHSKSPKDLKNKKNKKTSTSKSKSKDKPKTSRPTDNTKNLLTETVSKYSNDGSSPKNSPKGTPPQFYYDEDRWLSSEESKNEANNDQSNFSRRNTPIDFYQTTSPVVTNTKSQTGPDLDAKSTQYTGLNDGLTSNEKLPPSPPYYNETGDNTMNVTSMANDNNMQNTVQPSYERRSFKLPAWSTDFEPTDDNEHQRLRLQETLLYIERNPNPKVFSTQVDNDVPLQKEQTDDQLLWNSGFACSVCLILSAINYFYFAVCTVSSQMSLLSDFAVPYFIWILPYSMIVFIIVSLISVIYDWGRNFPKNMLAIFFYILCWTSFWIILTGIVLKATEPSSVITVTVPSVVECIATSCLILAFVAKIYPSFDLKTWRIYILGLGILFLHLTIKIGLGYLEFFGRLGVQRLLIDNSISDAFGGIIFMYICFDLQAILRGHRPIGWPNQSIFGVVSIHQDIVWIIWDALKLLLYLLPCTYCKDGKHTIWRRWKCCNHNYLRMDSNAADSQSVTQ